MLNTKKYKKPYYLTENWKEYKKQWRKRNPEKEREYTRRYREKNPEKIKEGKRKYQQENRDKINEKKRIARKLNPDKFHKADKRWSIKNREKIKEYRKRPEAKAKKNLRRKIKRLKDPKYRVEANLHSAIWKAITKEKNGRKWEKLVGYSLIDLMKHLEVQFDEKMNWQNYGSYWWIDHIKPRSLFNYKTPEDEEFKKCWALENLQPMEKIANIRKYNHYDPISTI